MSPEGLTVHGIYWVDASFPGRVAVVARPRDAAGIGQLASAGFSALVSLLQADEAADVGLADEAAWCRAAGIAFHSLPITDHGIPARFEPIEAVVYDLARSVADGESVAAHCYAGLGRSPLLIASVLIELGWEPQRAVAALSKARGWPVPEMDKQHAWLAAFHERRQANDQR